MNPASWLEKLTHNISSSFSKSSNNFCSTSIMNISMNSNMNMNSTNFSFVVGMGLVTFLTLLLFVFPLMSYAFRPTANPATSSTPTSTEISKTNTKLGTGTSNALSASLMSSSSWQEQELNHSNSNQKSKFNYPQDSKRSISMLMSTSTSTSASTSTSIPLTPTSPALHSIQGGFKNVLNEVSAMCEERHAQVRKALEDFSQPFLGFTRFDDYNDESEDDIDVDINIDIDNRDVAENDQSQTVIVEGCFGNINNDIDDSNQTCSREEKEDNNKAKDKNNNDDNSDDNDDGITHFCFLVHGYRGKPADLLYLRSAMEDTAEKTFNIYDMSTQEQQPTTNSSLSSSLLSSLPSNRNNKHRIVLHSCQSNWNRTSDGVEAGGERIFDEMLDVIRSAMEEQIKSQNEDKNKNDSDDGIIDVTMSLIGNSLGGLYSRYAIARLAAYADVRNEGGDDGNEDKTDSDNLNETDDKSGSKSCFLIDGKIRVHFNIFCTTATPHLGVSGHTYFPLPRSAEVGIGSLMGQTGRDIFRMSSLVKRMCTDDSYLKPLGTFRKRIAYANGYHTDFVVSTNTAAFLHPESTIPHRLSNHNLDQQKDQAKENENGMVVATLYTDASETLSSPSTDSSNDKASPRKEETKKRLLQKLRSDPTAKSSVKEELLEMSSGLDQLGWKKVIVDLRNEMPMKLPVPRPRRIFPRIVKKWNSDVTDAESEIVADKVKDYEFDKMSSTPVSPSSSKILESRDVANAYSIPDDFIGLPLGHNTMVAVPQSRLTFVFKGGRPLMDKLAEEMIDEILNFDI